MRLTSEKKTHLCSIWLFRNVNLFTLFQSKDIHRISFIKDISLLTSDIINCAIIQPRLDGGSVRSTNATIYSRVAKILQRTVLNHVEGGMKSSINQYIPLTISPFNNHIVVGRSEAQIKLSTRQLALKTMNGTIIIHLMAYFFVDLK